MIGKGLFEIKGAEGKLIYGDITADTSKPVKGAIIFVHGFKGFKDWGAHNLVAVWFAERGYRFIKFNLSHSGATVDQPGDITDLKAFGDNTFSKELFDIDAVLTYVAQNYPKEHITLIGHSRGGGLSIIQAAKDERISNLITWASVIDFRKLWKQEQEETWITDGVIYIENVRTKQRMPLNLTLLEDYKSNAEILDIRSAAKKVAIPWLIVHGINDPGIPVSTADELAALQPDAKLLKLPEADHVFNARHPFGETSLPAALLSAVAETETFISNKFLN